MGRVFAPHQWSKADVEEWFDRELTDEQWDGVVDRLEMDGGVDDATEILFELVRVEVDKLPKPPTFEEQCSQKWIVNEFLESGLARIVELRALYPEVPSWRWDLLRWDFERAVEENK